MCTFLFGFSTSLAQAMTIRFVEQTSTLFNFLYLFIFPYSSLFSLHPILSLFFPYSSYSFTIHSPFIHYSFLFIHYSFTIHSLFILLIQYSFPVHSLSTAAMPFPIHPFFRRFTSCRHPGSPFVSSSPSLCPIPGPHQSSKPGYPATFCALLQACRRTAEWQRWRCQDYDWSDQ